MRAPDGDGGPRTDAARARRGLLDALTRHIAPKAGRVTTAVLRTALYPPVRRVTAPVIAFDADLGQRGAAASTFATLRALDIELWIARQPGAALESASDSRPFAPEAPLLVVANHPGTYDFYAIAAAIARDDIKGISSHAPWDDGLPNVQRHLIYVKRGAPRGEAIGGAVAHLMGGGMLLHFPAGRQEPDPATAGPAETLLLPWFDGLDRIVQLVAEARRDLTVLPVAVSGLSSRRATSVGRLLGPTPAWGAAIRDLLQLARVPGCTAKRVELRFGEPLRAADLGEKPSARLRATLSDLVDAARAGR